METEPEPQHYEAPAPETTAPPANDDEINPIVILVERLAVEAHNRRTRVKDFLSEYDRHCSGYITPTQFERALSATKLTISPSELSALTAAYSVQKTNYGGAMVDYAAFCEPFGEKDLEKAPKRTARDPRSQLLYTDIARGVKPPPRFIGANDLDAPDVPPLQDGNTTRRWDAARVPGEPKPRPSRNPDTMEHPTLLGASRALQKLTPEQKTKFKELIRRLRGVVRTRGIHPKALFADFDKSRNGFVTKTQFRQSLPPVFQLTAEDYELLRIKFTKGHNEDVNYQAFHEMLIADDAAPYQADVANPHDVVGLTTRDLTKSALPNEYQNVATREHATKELLSRLNDAVFANKIRIRDFFKPYDKFLTGHVLPAKFQQAILASGLEVSEADMVLLFRQYARQPDGKINFHAFCKRMEEQDTGLALADTTTLYATAGPKKLPKGVDPKTGKLRKMISKSGIHTGKLLLKIQNHVARNRVRVLEFFRDFDKLRKGWVTRDKFRSALATMGLDLTPEELKILEERFVVEETIRSTKDIDYLEFAEWLDSAFARKHLEKTPTAIPAEFVPAEEDPIYMTEEEADLLEDIMERLAKATRDRGILLKPAFRDRDPQNRGKCTRNQFLSCTTSLGLPLQADEAELVFLRFRDNHKDNRGDIRYAEFCRILEQLAAEGAPQ
eukprot:TRINITY_DN4323_c0_g1_i1.p1 TRINITY_DN4323_c0_g1~~TRINITY_DN4323_c0_g1_i1.p1  ORF type:complete len:671 (+),score=210.84 TRINITY_DN4323_c0_g1_i1:876-2888(+)